MGSQARFNGLLSLLGCRTPGTRTALTHLHTVLTPLQLHPIDKLLQMFNKVFRTSGRVWAKEIPKVALRHVVLL